MKKLLCIWAVILVFLCACSHNDLSEQSGDEYLPDEIIFNQNENGNLVNTAGEEYAHLANEGFLCYFGELKYEGSVDGEEKASQHLDYSYQTGMFSISDNESNSILIRYVPNDEWYGIYRKTSLPALDTSLENCCRLELVVGNGYTEEDVAHMTCGEGITTASEIQEFLKDVRSQQNPHDAGLYDMITKPDGMFENCYLYGVIYGFFEDEPYLAIPMSVTSFNDQAYSVQIDEKEYVLPEEWLHRLQNNQ